MVPEVTLGTGRCKGACNTACNDGVCGVQNESNRVKSPIAQRWRNDMRALQALTTLLAAAPRRLSLGLIAMMLINASAEGIGIMLLVPILAFVGGTGQGVSWLAMPFAWVGIEPSLLALLGLLVVLVSFRVALHVIVTRVQNTLEHGLVDGLRQTYFDRLLHAEWRWLAQGKTAVFQAMLITNIGRIGQGLTRAISMMASLLLAIAYLCAALWLSWPTALLMIGGGALVAIGFVGIRANVTIIGQNLGRANQYLQARVQEGIAAIRITKLTGSEARQSAQFKDAVTALRLQHLAYVRQSLVQHAVFQIGGALLLGLLVYCSIMVWQVSVVVLLPLLLVSIRLVPMLAGLQESWSHWLHAEPALREFRAMLSDMEQHAEPLPGGTEPMVLNQAVELESVTLVYAGRKAAALRDVAMTIPANKTTAIIGTSGAGKSTLADVLTGLMEVDAGKVSVDGVAITGSMRLRWRHSVSYVQQDVFLFHDSIRANLLWAKPDASDAELGAVLAMAAAEFATLLPDGLDTIVGDGGVRLSGGERQRIALARALLRSPALLILDEATSALDPENEAAIREAIAGLRGKLTVVIVGHRRTMLDQADQIIEMDAGRVIRSGATYVDKPRSRKMVRDADLQETAP